ncbi:uncharacterized protein LOC112142076 isoform X1 [Oryzias melastigma]|uniref:uncharacterized protein LOC112142076 isoform X1 n=1 Tax=Oryzias melastigma TaxID=30732 RepID=UPI000CF812A8|nr:uncharacterized protein LOC112142076 isoform X1 [Oryzias melastigma]
MDESDEPPRGDIPDRRAGATGRAITKKKKKLQTISQHMRRRKHLQKLKKHHRKCEKRYNKAQMKLANRERERTLRLQSCTNSEEKHSSSENTIILDQTPTELSQDSSVPELKRTDSVYVTREMIGLSESSSCSGSGEEYIPQAESEESTDDETAVPPTRQPQKKMRKETKRRGMSQSGPLAENHDLEASSDDDSVVVMTLKKKEDGSRLYNKSFYCVYCYKPFKKIARHLQSKHKDKPEVLKAFQCPKGSKERKIQLSLLRNKGNRIHNNKVLKEGKGMVIPRQQTSAPVKVTDFMHCINCEAYLKRKSLWKHMKRCHLSKEVKGLKPGKTRVQALCAYAQPVPDNVSAQFWKMVLEMHNDEVSDIVRKEPVILKFGEHLYGKHGHDVTKHEYIRQKLRETGRLVLQAKRCGKLKRISDFFLPANFPHVIEAVHKVAGFSQETSTFKTPSLALKLGHNLKKMANIVEYEAMVAGDEKTINAVQMFKQICETKWSEVVSSQALRNMSEAKWNAPQLLPFAEDVKKMHEYISMQRKECQTNLEVDPSKKHWADLAKITLCEIIIFNRRREGEVSKMYLHSFALRDTTQTHPDLELALTDLEKKLCNHFQRIEIRGKRGRKVPVLLTPEVVTSMEILVKTRFDCGVPENNPFFFGRPDAATHFRGSDVIRHTARSCGAKHPEALSSTKLRKHVATMSKVLNLKDNEMDDLADFLGHDIRVHRQYYRLPEGTLQMAKVSKVLLALEQGHLSDYKGKNLDEIQIDPEEEIALEPSDSDDEADKTLQEVSPQGPVRARRATDLQERTAVEKDKEIQLPVETPVTSSLRDGPSRKRKWSEEEVEAVEKTLMEFITMRKVPGKTPCQLCIQTSPAALENRTWEGIKYYVKNRIDALKRKEK